MRNAYSKINNREYDRDFEFDCVYVDMYNLNLNIHVEIEEGHEWIQGVDIDAEELKKKFLESIDLDKLTEEYRKHRITLKP